MPHMISQGKSTAAVMAGPRRCTDARRRHRHAAQRRHTVANRAAAGLRPDPTRAIMAREVTMKTLIAYRSKYGTTAACARALGQRIGAQTVIADLASPPWPNAAEFDVVLIGGSIYSGRIQREVRVFCDRHRDDLLRRRVGLFLCCMYQGEHALAQLKGAYPGWLSAHAFGAGLFGGELHHARLSLLDKLLLLGLPRASQEVLQIDESAIESMAAAVNKARSVS